MPDYEYICQGCKHVFTATMSIHEHDKRNLECPKCKSTKVEWHPQMFQAVTSKKS